MHPVNCGKMRKSGLIIFDGDDTLWWSEELYDHTRASAREVVEQAGLDGSRWEALQRKKDLENVRVMGLSSARFPLSCQQAYNQLAQEQGVDPDPIVARQVHQAARQVFESKAEVAPNARHVLFSLKNTYEVVLLTKGDQQVQEKRIDDSGLRDCFHEIFIVDKKNQNTFLDIVKSHGYGACEAWSIGNSLPSDINPALTIGMKAIWIDAHVWEHERREKAPLEGRLYCAATLWEALEIINQEDEQGDLVWVSAQLADQEAVTNA